MTGFGWYLLGAMTPVVAAGLWWHEIAALYVIGVLAFLLLVAETS